MLETAGIHHISVMVNDAQRTVTFYTGILGVRLVKKTVNYARPDGYHLYFGNDAGEPGSIITFFPSANQLRGRIGTSQVGGISFQIPEGVSTFWERRLARFQIAFTTSLRFGERYIKFDDPDGLPIELVEQREGSRDLAGFGALDREVAITGLGGATLLSRQPEKTAAMLEGMLGLKKFGQERDFLRFESGAAAGNRIDIGLTAKVRGLMGAGTIHHLAWRAGNEAELNDWRTLLDDRGYHPTEIHDRTYFKALYFHEDGGILFEIATDSPGFTVDEQRDKLGKKLKLPAWLEEKREVLEQRLPPIEVRKLEGS